MKNKHKIMLTLIASLGLFSLGVPAINAKNINHGHHNNSTIIGRMIHNMHSKAKSHQPQPIISPHHKNQSNDDNNNDDNNSKKPEKSKSSLKKSKSSLNSSIISNNNKSNHSKSNQNSKSNTVNNFDFNNTKLSSHPHNDHYYNNIDKMNAFAKKRRPFHYTVIGGNTRDLGGYRTANHKYQVRVGRIIRSADLNKISKSGIKGLQKLHVNKIIDLRYVSSRNGIKGHPDPNELKGKTLKGTNIEYQQNPVYSFTESHEFDHYLKSHNVHGEYYFYGAPSVTEPDAIASYRTTFNDLLNNHHGAILYHCNLGRDRTGVTSALILSALGVSNNTIFHDYLLTDYYHYNYHRKPYSQQAGELMYFFHTINKKYGSVNNYLHKAIGLSDDDINQLRSMYLIPANIHQTNIKLRKHNDNYMSHHHNHNKFHNHKSHKSHKDHGYHNHHGHHSHHHHSHNDDDDDDDDE